MVSDSIPNAAIASSNPSDFAKKKRANRSAKLKQCKLDARREQWLSQVKNKGESKEEAKREKSKRERSGPTVKLEIKIRNEDEIYGDGCSIHHYCDSDSSSVLFSNDSGPHFSASSRTSSSSGRSITSCSNSSLSLNMSEEDNADDDDCLDDWEAMADALADEDKNQAEDHNPSSKNHENRTEANCAWRPDDARRPQSLPNLVKQYSLPSVWGRRNVGPIPTSCPICFEDLDRTDTSFLPCGCGFRLCLFCHKRILEEDGRCPGCRKPYEFERVEGEAILARSSSMIMRC